LSINHVYQFLLAQHIIAIRNESFKQLISILL
jgi:hypothetical protein